MAERNNASVATAKAIPIFLALIVGYSSYAITGPLAIQYLLPKRVAVGLAIPVAYYFLLIPVAATWLRLLIVVWAEPGYVPRGVAQDGEMAPPRPLLQKAPSETRRQAAAMLIVNVTTQLRTQLTLYQSRF